MESRVRKENLRYSTDIFRPGQLVVSGCDLDTSFLDHATASFPLQSWGPELRHLVESEEGMQCDDTIDTPTLMVKLDATSNMYHHFCDFFNIFISLNLNGSIVPEAAGRQILILDNHPYHSSFRPAWKSVTDRHLWDLNSVAGKRICFTDLLMPLLPRMVYGLYYGTPLIPGCHSSSMFSAFSTWFSSALGLPSPSTQLPLRLTLLSRATKYRQILNEQEIVEALSAKGYQVTVAKFTPLVPFQEQLETIRNTDILVRISLCSNLHKLIHYQAMQFMGSNVLFCGRWVFMVLASLICSSFPTGRMLWSSTIAMTLAAIRWYLNIQGLLIAGERIHLLRTWQDSKE